MHQCGRSSAIDTGSSRHHYKAQPSVSVHDSHRQIRKRSTQLDQQQDGVLCVIGR